MKIIQKYFKKTHTLNDKLGDIMKSCGGLMEMLGSFTVLRLIGMMGMMNISFTKEELLEINKKLNRIKKPK